MSKTVCFFSAQYLPHLGGVERYTYNLSKKLIEKGYRVIVVTSMLDTLPREEVIEGIQVYRMDSFQLMGDRFPIMRKTKHNREIEKKLVSSNISQIIVNTRFYPLSLYGLKFAKKHNISSLLIEHSTGHIEFDNKIISKIGEKYDHWITNRIKKYNNNFYGVSEACNKWLTHFDIIANGKLYNAIDINHIKSIQSTIKEKYRLMKNITKDSIVISFTGRLIEEKGILELVKAIKEINIKGHKVHLFIAGDGPLYDDLKREESSSISVLGKINFEEVVALLTESNVFCFPTNYPEGFSTSVLEAAACHCYIITTDRGGSKELVLDEQYGTILLDGKKEYIIKALEKTLEDETILNKVTEKTYQRLIDNFIWDKTADRIHQILLENN